MNIIVDGIYDIRTLRRLKELGVTGFSFDFRVKSFNFLQQHQFEEVLKYTLDSDQLFLRFENEKDYIIQNILETPGLSSLNSCIVFDDALPSDDLINLTHSFIWNFSLGQSLDSRVDELLKLPNLSSVIINYSELIELSRSNDFSRVLNQVLLPIRDIYGKKIILRSKWNFDHIDVLFDFFQFDSFFISLDSNVEVCYRNIDLDKMSNDLKLISTRS